MALPTIPIHRPVKTVAVAGPGTSSENRLFATVSFWAAMVLVLVAGLRSAIGRSLRLDEAFSLETSAPGQSLRHVVHQALWFEQQPPLYFTLLHFWLSLINSPVFGRFLSTLAVAGAIVIM